MKKKKLCNCKCTFCFALYCLFVGDTFPRSPPAHTIFPGIKAALYHSHQFKAAGGDAHCGCVERPEQRGRSRPAAFITPDVLFFNASPETSAPSEGHLSLRVFPPSSFFFGAHHKSCDPLRPQVELLPRGQDSEPSGTFHREPRGPLCASGHGKNSREAREGRRKRKRRWTDRLEELN